MYVNNEMQIYKKVVKNARKHNSPFAFGGSTKNI